MTSSGPRVTGRSTAKESGITTEAEADLGVLSVPSEVWDSPIKTLVSLLTQDLCELQLK